MPLKKILSRLAGLRKKPFVETMLPDPPVQATHAEFPWMQLFESFIADNSRRMAEAQKANLSNKLIEMEELRLLTVKGPRQCGKTEACLALIRKYPQAKFAVNQFYVPYYKRQLGARFNDVISLTESVAIDWDQYPFDKEDFAGVKLFIIDAERDSKVDVLKMAYKNHPDWFHPEFMVIRVEE